MSKEKIIKSKGETNCLNRKVTFTAKLSGIIKLNANIGNQAKLLYSQDTKKTTSKTNK